MTEEPLWTVEDIARLLVVGQASVRDWARQSRLPAIKIGSGRRTEWRFVPEKIRAYLEEQSNQPKKKEG